MTRREFVSNFNRKYPSTCYEKPRQVDFMMRSNTILIIMIKPSAAHSVLWQYMGDFEMSITFKLSLTNKF